MSFPINYPPCPRCPSFYIASHIKIDQSDESKAQEKEVKKQKTPKQKSTS